MQRQIIVSLLFISMILLFILSCGDDDDSENSSSNLNECNTIWTDPATDLMWQTGELTMMDFFSARTYCEDLILGDYTHWSLPTISELRSLVQGCPKTKPSGYCNVEERCSSPDCFNSACNGCKTYGGPGREGLYWSEELLDFGTYYWSSTEVINSQSWRQWCIDFRRASLYQMPVEHRYPTVRCVNREDGKLI